MGNSYFHQKEIYMKNLKKTSIIISSYDDIKNPYYGGGGAYAVHEIAKRLSSHFNVTVISGKYPDSKDEIMDGVLYQHIGNNLFGPKLGQIFFQLHLMFLIPKLHFSLLIESFTPPISTTCLQKLTNKPVIGLVHMLSGEDMKRKYHLPFDQIERIGLKTYRYLISTSDNLTERLKKITPKTEVVTITNGVERIIKTPKLRKKFKHILFIGRIEVNQKGLDLLLSAYSLIQGSINLPLIIAGSGEEREINNLNSMIRNLNLSGKVSVIGRVLGNRKVELFQNTACIVCPSRFETFSITALESLANGIPLVTFDINGLRWITNNCALKTNPFKVSLFSENILRICRDHKLREKVFKNGLKLSDAYSWENSFNNYLSFIDHVLNND